MRAWAPGCSEKSRADGGCFVELSISGGQRRWSVSRECSYAPGHPRPHGLDVSQGTAEVHLLAQPQAASMTPAGGPLSFLTWRSSALGWEWCGEAQGPPRVPSGPSGICHLPCPGCLAWASISPRRCHFAVPTTRLSNAGGGS